MNLDIISLEDEEWLSAYLSGQCEFEPSAGVLDTLSATLQFTAPVECSEKKVESVA